MSAQQRRGLAALIAVAVVVTACALLILVLRAAPCSALWCTSS